MRYLHLVWCIRHAALFDLFASEILSPLVNDLPGVFVHIFITGTPEFTVSTPEKMLAIVQAGEESTGQNENLKRDVDPHRSVLNLTEDVIVTKSNKLSGSNPMSTTHNIILDTVKLEVTNNSANFATSTNLFVSFGRPDYGEEDEKYDTSLRCTHCTHCSHGTLF